MHVKVLIAQTGSIDYVTEEYYERYKNEGIILIPEDEPKVDLEELKVVTKELKADLEEPKKTRGRQKKH